MLYKRTWQKEFEMPEMQLHTNTATIFIDNLEMHIGGGIWEDSEIMQQALLTKSKFCQFLLYANSITDAR